MITTNQNKIMATFNIHYEYKDGWVVIYLGVIEIGKGLSNQEAEKNARAFIINLFKQLDE